MNVKYIIITPAKNEEKYVRYILESVCSQSVKPYLWIIVDDGSTDDTPNIVKEYMIRHPWIHLVKNETISEKKAGGSKVVKAFYKGYEAVPKTHYDFIVKLDADLTLPITYFEEVALCFKKNPKVGLCGGYCVNKVNDQLVKERVAEYHIRGAFKAYRGDCFKQIGGLKEVYNWDGLDQMYIMYYGWDVKVLPLEVIHHRKTSTDINRGLRNSIMAGVEYYRDGNDIILSLFRSIVYGMDKSPIIITGISFLFGYIYASISRMKKHVDYDLEKFIRDFQYKRISRHLSKFIK